MSDREFENYLTIISRLLRLNRGQAQAVGEELRDHFESRVAELTARGVARDDAVRSALEEFGDAAGLAAQFSKITQTRKRRWIMRCTVASISALAAAVVVAMAVWPDNQANQVVNRAAAQTAAKMSDPKMRDALLKEARTAGTDWERKLFRIQHLQCNSLANTISTAFAGPNGAIVTAVTDSNSILIAAAPDTLNEIAKLLSELDRPAPSIGIEVWIVNLQPESLKRGDNHGPIVPTDFLAPGRRTAVLEKLHQLEKEGRATVANHFQLTCLDNQQAFTQQGERRPGTTVTNTTSPGKTSTTGSANLGAILHLQPRVSSGNEIVMAIDAEKSTPAPEVKAAAFSASKGIERSEMPEPNSIVILGQSTIHIASGDIVSLTGIESMSDDSASSYQVLVSAEVLPQNGAAK